MSEPVRLRYARYAPGDRDRAAPPEPSGHLDPFCRDALPPRALWPRFLLSRPELRYPPRFNAAAELLDGVVAAGRGDRPAILSPNGPGGDWTYRDLRDAVRRIARVLTEDLGLVPGNRVLLRSPNTPLLAACWLAVVHAGGVVVATMPLLRRRELAAIVHKARIRLALTDARIAPECEAAMPEGARTVRFQGDGGPGSLEAMMRTKPADLAPCDTAAEDVAAILFTSGTTGEAKGTLQFHRDLLAITDCFPRAALRPTPEDVFCGTPSLAFAYGIGVLLLAPLRF